VISILGETLQPLDSDGLIPAYGFGDFVTKGDGIFPLKDYVSSGHVFFKHAYIFI
jgi:hypothetical protein